jgi:hypothetical protein
MAALPEPEKNRRAATANNPNIAPMTMNLILDLLISSYLPLRFIIAFQMIVQKGDVVSDADATLTTNG